MSNDNYSLSARVYNHIRDGILAGTFAKGDELKEKNIGDELGVSRTPVREAYTGSFQGLYCHAEAEHVPVASHDTHRPERTAV